jgi:hypothetical protein
MSTTSTYEIAPDIFRLSIYVPEFDMQFNHFLVRDEEPLLFHAGLKGMLPALREAVAKIIDPAKLQFWGAIGGAITGAITGAAVGAGIGEKIGANWPHPVPSKHASAVPSGSPLNLPNVRAVDVHDLPDAPKGLVLALFEGGCWGWAVFWGCVYFWWWHAASGCRGPLSSGWGGRADRSSTSRPSREPTLEISDEGDEWDYDENGMAVHHRGAGFRGEVLCGWHTCGFRRSHD